MIVRVFPRRTKATPTDELAFVGDPPLFRPDADEVHVSTAFTWDKPEAERLARAWEAYYPGRVNLGGPAFEADGGDFIPGRYLRHGYVITSRGCPNRCPWCLVWRREGGIRELPIRDGWDVQDNNLLACSDAHIEQVFDMLGAQGRRVRFTGGLEAERLTDARIEQLRSLSIEELFVAYDARPRWAATEAAILRLRSAGLSLRQVRCYVLCGFGGDTPAEAEARLEHVLRVGSLPFAMLYQPADKYIEYPRDWRALQRKWTRPAAMLAATEGRESGGDDA